MHVLAQVILQINKGLVPAGTIKTATRVLVKTGYIIVKSITIMIKNIAGVVGLPGGRYRNFNHPLHAHLTIKKGNGLGFARI